MEFCPECDAKMRKGGAGLVCPKCGRAGGPGAPRAAPGAEPEDPAEGLNVFEGDEGDEALSTVKVDCEKCGNGEAVWWMLQTRSADEPTTQFYRCTKCAHTWRNYA